MATLWRLPKKPLPFVLSSHSHINHGWNLDSLGLVVDLLLSQQAFRKAPVVIFLFGANALSVLSAVRDVLFPPLVELLFVSNHRNDLLNVSYLNERFIFRSSFCNRFRHKYAE